jgi:hypothetical protein
VIAENGGGTNVLGSSVLRFEEAIFIVFRQQSRENVKCRNEFTSLRCKNFLLVKKKKLGVSPDFSLIWNVHPKKHQNGV